MLPCPTRRPVARVAQSLASATVSNRCECSAASNAWCCVSIVMCSRTFRAVRFACTILVVQDSVQRAANANSSSSTRSQHPVCVFRHAVALSFLHTVVDDAVVDSRVLETDRVASALRGCLQPRVDPGVTPPRCSDIRNQRVVSPYYAFGGSRLPDRFSVRASC